MHAHLPDTTLFYDIDGAEYDPGSGELLRKPVLVVLHGGLGFDHAYLKPGLGPLRDHAQLLYVDLRGQGRSGRPPLETCTLEQMADDVAALCASLGLPHVHVFGHSAGGFVALHLALRHPALVAGLILCGSSPTVRPIIEDEAAEPAPSLASRAGPETLAVAGRVFGGDITEESVDDFFREVGPFYAAPAHMHVPPRLTALSTMDVAMMRHFMTAIAPGYDLRPRLGGIAARTLVIVGREDWVCPPRASRALARGIPGARLVVLDDAGHFTFSETPAAFLDAVVGFLPPAAPV
ncbi:alpha/beta fold hydrolase [Cupriavidus plantarum]|uniref:alpha/beta fold hydrolase n=1 Tax=Cupriavidus plantarum TaxID=942865 RepID=UPI000E386D6F|nr:alpha/beta fold hydrolase [Cupriavidus plantarum]NYH98959.1 proline iminopeptidase [Cupriavidus plantarum]REF03070.1 proline iminopeptidase [Cupriavidus plantarum]RLK44064.1 proline iminopeptidase [Cupriavidus plantarum]